MGSIWIGPIDGQRTLVEGVVDNGAAGGDYTAIAGVANEFIRVYRIAIVIAAATNIVFKSGSTALTGSMNFSSIGSIVLDQSGLPWYVTTPGASFIINSSNGVQIGGTVWYTQNVLNPPGG